jgi:WD40 repeat protein
VLSALDAGNLRFLNHPYGNVFASLRLGVDALPAAVRERYSELAVAPADVALPVSLVALLWRRTGGLEDYETRRMLAELHRKGLLDLDGDGDHRGVRFHDLQHDFLQLSAPDLRGLHRRFLDAAASGLQPPAASSHRAWSALAPDQPYLWRHLAHHLSQAGLEDELNALLLDFDWVAAKLRVTDVNAAIADYEVAGLDAQARLVQRALRFSRHVLARDAAQLPGQLLAHLGPAAAGAAAAMSAGAARTTGTWLRPLSATHALAAGPLLQTLSGHTGDVLAVVAMDRNRVVSASDDGTLRVWDVESGVQLRVITGALSADFPGDTALDRLDARRVLVGVDSHVAVWDIESGTLAARFVAHDKRVVDVAALDAESFVSIDADRTMLVWHVGTAAPSFRQEVGSSYGGLYARLAALDRERVVCCPGDSSVEVWDLANGTRVLRLEAHNEVSPAIAVVDRNRFVAASEYGIVREWDVASGAVLRTFTGHRDWVRRLTTLKGGRLAWALDDGSVQITDLTTGEAVERFGGHSDAVLAVADLEQGRVVSASGDGTLRVWELGTGHAQTNWPSWGTGEETRSVAALDDTLVVAARAQHPPHVFDARSGGGIRTLPHDNAAGVHRVDDRRVLTLSSTHGTRLWDARTGALLAEVEATSSKHDDVAALANGRFALTAFHAVIIFDPGTRTVEKKVKTGFEIDTVSAIDDSRLAVADFHGQLSVYDVGTGKLLWRTEGVTYWSRTGAAAIDGNTFAVGDSTSVQLLDIATGKERNTLTGHSEAIEYIEAFNRRWIVSAAGDGTIRVWELQSGRSVKTLERPGSWPPVIAKLDEDHVIWADRNTVHAFQLSTLANVAAFTLDAPASALACLPASRMIAVGDVQGNVHTFRLETAGRAEAR